MNSHCLCLFISVPHLYFIFVSFSNPFPFFTFLRLLFNPIPSSWRKHLKGRITVMSSLNEISMDQLVNRVVVRGRRPFSALLQTFFMDRYLKTTWTVSPPPPRDLLPKNIEERPTDLVKLHNCTFAQFKTFTLRGSEEVQVHCTEKSDLFNPRN